MRIKPDCIICVMRQCLEASSLAGADEETTLDIIKEISKLIPNFNTLDTPMSITMAMHRVVRKITGIDDPYKKVKKEYNEKGKQAYPYLLELLQRSDNKLETAVKIAIAGNIVDYALPIEKDLDKSLQTALETSLPSRDWNLFEGELKNSRRLLYLLDNAGEVFYDKVFIEYLLGNGYDVTAVVRGGPAINDATIDDAIYAGLDKITKIITTGIDTVGFIFEQASPIFLKALDEAELIIAKGQANLESLDETDYPAFFLLKAKCPIIAELTERETGDIVFQANPCRWRK